MIIGNKNNLNKRGGRIAPLTGMFLAALLVLTSPGVQQPVYGLITKSNFADEPAPKKKPAKKKKLKKKKTVKKYKYKKTAPKKKKVYKKKKVFKKKTYTKKKVVKEVPAPKPATSASEKDQDEKTSVPAPQIGAGNYSGINIPNSLDGTSPGVNQPGNSLPTPGSDSTSLTQKPESSNLVTGKQPEDKEKLESQKKISTAVHEVENQPFKYSKPIIIFLLVLVFAIFRFRAGRRGYSGMRR